MTSRREFVEQSALAGLAMALPLSLPRHHGAIGPSPRGFLSLLRPPDRMVVESASGMLTLRPMPDGTRWSGDQGIAVTTAPSPAALSVTLASPALAIKRIRMRWHGALADTRLILGDAWERAYGDLEWRGWVPDRVMPWYFAATTSDATHCYGVRTGPAAFCSWSVDPDGITLTADVRSGSSAVQLGERVLSVCTVVCRPGHAGESPFAAVHAFCRQMCAAPRLPADPVYGSNDWYWAYGNNSAASVRADAQRIVDLSPTGSNRPFVVIDDGWQPEGGHDKNGAGLWDRGNEKFGDMHALAGDVRRTGGRAGIWIRALQAPADAPASWRLTRDRTTLDPTIPDVLHKVTADITRLREWGFDLIKHDYSTFDIFGRWGSQMGSALTRDGWTFANGADRTSAEVIDTLYATIAAAAGESLVIGCNTVSHLSAGHFALCRVGDDTSGNEWGRVRKMGVNSLAFRGAQHDAFYVTDADCVGVTTQLPWALNRQWLDLLAESGTTLFVSLAPDAVGDEQRRDLQRALAMAATRQPLGEPLDWQHNLSPDAWRLRGQQRTFDWIGADGGLTTG
ncbi:MAG TPA: hypothetical protein VGM77_03280 [Gemmatimonadales bacterium]|jgi:alpha-galactosidase